MPASVGSPAAPPGNFTGGTEQKFPFPFCFFQGARKIKKCKENVFAWHASVSERRRGGASVSFKKGSRIFKQRAPVRKSQISLVRLASLGDQIVRDFGRKNQLAVLF